MNFNKRILGVILAGTLASTSAIANPPSHSGTIKVSGIVSSYYSITVTDLNPNGFDFDFDAAAILGDDGTNTATSMRVGTVYIATNNDSTTSRSGRLHISSANGGKMVINGGSSLSGHQKYTITMTENALDGTVRLDYAIRGWAP